MNAQFVLGVARAVQLENFNKDFFAAALQTPRSFLYGDKLCKHCRRWEDDHVNGKCLFDNTMFEEFAP